MKKSSWVSWLILGLIYSGLTSAGTLDNFEKSATEKNQSSESNSGSKNSGSKRSGAQSNSNDSDDDDKDFFDYVIEAMFYIFVDIITLGGAQSDYRNSGGAPSDFEFSITPRKRGEPIIPVFRLDLNYQDLRSDIHAWDSRVEAGYGRFGVMYRNSLFRESNPNDSLRYEQWAVLYRMSFGANIEWDFGVGSSMLKGNSEHDGSFVTTPVYFRLNEQFSLHFRPSWSDFSGAGVDDSDTALIYTRDQYSFSFGFRRMKTEGEVLDGLYAGVSYIY